MSIIYFDQVYILISVYIIVHKFECLTNTSVGKPFLDFAKIMYMIAQTFITVKRQKYISEPKPDKLHPSLLDGCAF